MRSIKYHKTSKMRSQSDGEKDSADNMHAVD